MNFKYLGYGHLFGLTSSVSEIEDMKLGHVNLQEFWERISKRDRPPIIEIPAYRKWVVVSIHISIAMQYTDLVLECINHYNPQNLRSGD